VPRTKLQNTPEDYHKILGERIRRARRDRQMTQLDLARRVGVTNGQISTIERGLSAPSIGTLRRISAALEVPLVDFFEPAGVREIQIVRAGERGRITSPLGSEVIDILAGSSLIAAVQVNLDPDQGCVRAGSREASEVFLYVLDGQLELATQGRQYSLRMGDSLMADGRHKLELKNSGRSTAHLLDVRVNARM
ncbi:MAG: helix-turn-helix domain-containing protein, partial [Candidatus Aminicenantes bacterium RBG_16_66_30]